MTQAPLFETLRDTVLSPTEEVWWMPDEQVWRLCYPDGSKLDIVPRMLEDPTIVARVLNELGRKAKVVPIPTEMRTKVENRS